MYGIEYRIGNAVGKSPQILQDNGIRWARTYGRDYRDCQPTPFTVQPFFYADQGFPDILERLAASPPPPPMPPPMPRAWRKTCTFSGFTSQLV